MKRFLLTAMLFCTVIALMGARGIFSPAPKRPDCVGDELHALLEKKHYDWNAERIQELTFGMDVLDRQAIFDFYSMDGKKAASENGFT